MTLGITESLHSDKMKKENVALIGYGYWGKKLYSYLKESDKFHLCYVFFPSLKNYDNESINRKFGKEFTSDIEKIWRDTNVANIIIASPIDTHFEVVCCALSHSKNVLVEKPLTKKAKDANSLAEMARQRNLILETEYTYTYSAALNFAKKTVDDGRIGRIQSISICFSQLGRFLPYDVYFLLGSHALSILDLFMPLNEFTFNAFPLMATNGIVTSALIQFKSEKMRCRGHIDVSLHCPERDKKVAIFGEKGTIVYAPDARDTLTLTLYKRSSSLSGQDLIERNEHFQFDENHNLRNALENFYCLTQNNKECNIARAVAINSILERLSATSGRV